MNYNYYNDRYPKHFDEKYKDIPYLFLDIPKIVPDDNFKELWDTKKVSIVRQKPDDRYPFKNAEEAEVYFQQTGRTNEYAKSNWDGFIALSTKAADDRWASSIVDGPTLLPKFFQQLYEYLPIARLTQVLFWSNNIGIGVHRDLSEQYSWPSSIRLMVEDENTQPTFFLTPFDENLPANTPSLPIPDNIYKRAEIQFIDTNNSSSNVFMYNNKQWAHGAIKVPGRRKILCALGIDYDFDKLEVLLDRSIAKYGKNLRQQ